MERKNESRKKRKHSYKAPLLPRPALRPPSRQYHPGPGREPPPLREEYSGLIERALRYFLPGTSRLVREWGDRRSRLVREYRFPPPEEWRLPGARITTALSLEEALLTLAITVPLPRCHESLFAANALHAEYGRNHPSLPFPEGTGAITLPAYHHHFAITTTPHLAVGQLRGSASLRATFPLRHGEGSGKPPPREDREEYARLQERLDRHLTGEHHAFIRSFLRVLSLHVWEGGRRGRQRKA